MKTKFTILLAAIMLICFNANAQQDKKMAKALAKELNTKVDKDSRKEAKKLAKQGWKTNPGMLPIEKQIHKSKFAQITRDEEQNLSYITGSSKAVGGNYNIAKEIAESKAKQQIVGLMEENIKKDASIESAMSDLGDGDIIMKEKIVSSSRSRINSILRNSESFLEIYRELEDGKYEVNVMLGVKKQEAIKHAKKVYMEELMKIAKERTDKL